MNLIKYFCLVAFTLFIIGVAYPAHAQYGFSSGYSYTTNPTSVPTGAGVAVTSNSCGCFLTRTGSLSVTYTGFLDWQGTGEPTSATILFENTHVDGSTTFPGSASSTAKILTPLAVSVNGGANNGFSYSPPDQPAVTGHIFATSFTGTLQCDVGGSGSAYAQITFHL